MRMAFQEIRNPDVVDCSGLLRVNVNNSEKAQQILDEIDTAAIEYDGLTYAVAITAAMAAEKHDEAKLLAKRSPPKPPTPS